jgi:thioredoxin reductase
VTQARKFDARPATPYPRLAGPRQRAQYRRLPVDDLDQYEGISVFYAAGPPEAQLCGAERVAVVEGGNQTTVPGVFAAGDVRSGSTKRCATAVQLVHAHLAASRPPG